MKPAELVALAEQCGAEAGRYEGEVVWVKLHQPSIAPLAAAVVAAQPKADERGSAELTGAAAEAQRWADGARKRAAIDRTDSAQARDAAHAVELTDADLPSHPDSHVMKWSDCERRAILEWGRALLAKNGLGGKQ
jgi:hypothetical protein